MLRSSVFVLDTSALLTLRGDERGADRVEALIRKAESGDIQLLASFMTRMELLYLIWREEGEPAARQTLRLVDSFPLEWITCEAGILESASQLKASGGLSVADCWIAATALIREAVLIHRDAEFRRFQEIRQQFLGS